MIQSKFIASLSALLFVLTIHAQNPIVQTKFTADPAPYVHGDTVYLYTSHDEDDAEGFHMKEWLLYTTTDMVNWQDHGAVASLKDFPWLENKENGAWAPQVIERDGKWYMYCPLHLHGIGVLVADSPYGPWRDPLGKPLLHQGNDDIDPTVWIDDDGQAYLYWGNPDLYMARLNEDMISIDGDIVKHAVRPEDYQEGPWFYKRGKYYYLAYSSTCCPEGMGYSMSKKPTGPWKKAGTLMDHNPKSNGNHPGIIHYKGHDYIFGFSYQLHQQESDIHLERRSVCAAEFEYNKDGSISELAFWDEQTINPVGTINPFERVEAETIAWSEGVKTRKAGVRGMVVTDIDPTDYIKVRSVDFGQGASRFTASIASIYKGGRIELRLDAMDGQLIGTCPMTSTGGWDLWAERTCEVSGAQGIHDLYLVFQGDGKHALGNVDWWKMESK